jgi:hypothetical protein
VAFVARELTLGQVCLRASSVPCVTPGRYLPARGLDVKGLGLTALLSRLHICD